MRAHNTALQRTAIPLRSIAAGELGRYVSSEVFLVGGVFTAQQSHYYMRLDTTMFSVN